MEGFRYLFEARHLDPNVRGYDGETSLIYATEVCVVEIVGMLVKYPIIYLSVHDCEGRNALTISEDGEIKELLLNAMERRWRNDWDIMKSQVLPWVYLRGLIQVHGFESISLLLDSCENVQCLMGHFEEGDIISWKEASTTDWDSAERVIGRKLAVGLGWVIRGDAESDTDGDLKRMVGYQFWDLDGYRLRALIFHYAGAEEAYTV